VFGNNSFLIKAAEVIPTTRSQRHLGNKNSKLLWFMLAITGVHNSNSNSNKKSTI